jgi:uncharacterized membrane protein YvlD (DUF360 family)
VTAAEERIGMSRRVGQIGSLGALLGRALVVWAVDAVSLLVLAWLLPGVALAGWQAALGAALVLGLLNASLRPLVLLGAINLGIIPFTLLAFLLNAVVVGLAGRWLPGFSVDGWGSAFLVAFGLALLNGLLTGLLSLNDQDTLYRNVTRRLARRRAGGPIDPRPGLAIVQIDGLAAGVLREELAAGKLPTLARWVDGGSHRLVGWECAVPSMTSAVQAGLFYGDNAEIPAFRWFDKAAGKMFVSNNPADARDLDARLAAGAAAGGGGLLAEGASISNLLTGGAGQSVMTMSGLVSAAGERQVNTRDFYSYLANPYNLTRGLLGFGGDVLVEYWEGWQQHRRKAEPRMHRTGVFPYLRAATTVIMRDAAVWLTVDAMNSGRRVAYMDFLGYDEVAHHAGHRSEDARRVLRRFDGHLAALEAAAARAPRPYELVVLSDHGQSTGATFKQRYGRSLGDLVTALIAGGPAPTGAPGAPESSGAPGGAGADTAVRQTGGDEGWGHLNALLTEIVRTEGVTGRGARRLLQGRAGGTPAEPEEAGDGQEAEGPYVALGPEAAEQQAAAAADVVVCPSGNLANIYFTRQPGRLSLEYLVATYPGLVEGLTAHAGIGFVLAYSEARGHVVLGARGARDLDGGRVVGDDPLAPFSPHLAAQLRRISGYANVGDLLVNSFYDPRTEEVAAFEELIGCHGGAGGPQQAPFLLYPAAWTAGPGEAPPELVGAEQVHAFLTRHAGSTPPAGPAALPFDAGPPRAAPVPAASPGPTDSASLEGKA